jgi:hypothetical protein
MRRGDLSAVRRYRARREHSGPPDRTDNKLLARQAEGEPAFRDLRCIPALPNSCRALLNETGMGYKGWNPIKSAVESQGIGCCTTRRTLCL